jgi:hypothetical protein
LQILLLYLSMGQILPAGIFQASSLAGAIKSKLKRSGIGDPDRSLDVGTKLSGLLTGGFDKLGYIPIATAVGQCEGQARYRLEKAVDRRVETL